jgi:hypothetical protein
MQEPHVDTNPDAPASRAFRILASRIAGFSPGGGDGLHLTAVSPVSAEASRCA